MNSKLPTRQINHKKKFFFYFFFPISFPSKKDHATRLIFASALCELSTKHSYLRFANEIKLSSFIYITEDDTV